MFEKKLGYCPKCKALCDLNVEHDCEGHKLFVDQMTQLAHVSGYADRSPIESRKDRRARERRQRKESK